MATFADDTAILTSDSDPAAASQILQMNLLELQRWLKRWRIKANESKSTHVTFTTRRATCPPVHINLKKSNISGSTLTEDLPGINIFSPSGNNSGSPSPKCNGCLDASHNCSLPTSYSSIKQF
jgi:hypothetical protein